MLSQSSPGSNGAAQAKAWAGCAGVSPPECEETHPEAAGRRGRVCREPGTTALARGAHALGVGRRAATACRAPPQWGRPLGAGWRPRREGGANHLQRLALAGVWGGIIRGGRGWCGRPGVASQARKGSAASSGGRGGRQAVGSINTEGRGLVAGGVQIERRFGKGGGRGARNWSEALPRWLRGRAGRRRSSGCGGREYAADRFARSRGACSSSGGQVGRWEGGRAAGARGAGAARQGIAMGTPGEHPGNSVQRQQVSWPLPLGQSTPAWEVGRRCMAPSRPAREPLLGDTRAPSLTPLANGRCHERVGHAAAAHHGQHAHHLRGAVCAADARATAAAAAAGAAAAPRAAQLGPRPFA